MAKQAARSGGTSRIRFVMFDAEVPEGEIGQLTQAMQKALLGTTPIVQRVVAPAALKAPDANGNGHDLEQESEQEDEVVEVAPAAARQSRQSTPRKPAATPNIIDMDMDADVSLVDFVQGKDAKSNHKRFLIAAAWLKEHRGIDAVNQDHIYTCYRKLDWPTNIADFAQPLRELKTRKFFTTPERGMYAINHIGLDAVKKNGGNGAA